MSTNPDVSADATKVEKLTEKALTSHSNEANSRLANELNDLAKKDPGLIKSINEQMKNDRSADPSLPKIEISYEAAKGDGFGGGTTSHVDIAASEGSGKSKVELGGASASQTTEDLGGGHSYSARVEESNQPSQTFKLKPILPSLGGLNM